MSTANLEKIRGIPGRLALGPSQAGLLTDYPHGGTALGTVESVDFAMGIRYRNVITEDWLEVVEKHRVAELPVFSFVLLDWDADVLARLGLTYTTGTGPASYQGAARLNGAAGPNKLTALDPLLFAPFDPKHPGLLIHRGLLSLEESATLRFAIGEPAVFPLIVEPTRTNSTPARLWQCDLLDQLEVGS